MPRCRSGWSIPRCAELRLLHVITGLNVGGAEHMLERLVGHLQGVGHENVVLSLLPVGTVGVRLAASGVAVKLANLRSGRSLVTGLQTLRRIMARYRPHLLQGWMYHGNLAATVGSWTLSRHPPVAWGIHASLGEPAELKPATRRIMRAGGLVSNSPAAIVHCSAASVDQHRRFGYATARSRVIPNGVDCTRYRPDAAADRRVRAMLGVPSGVPLLGMLARWHPQKDHANLLVALGKLRRRGCQMHVLLAGTGVDEGNSELMTLLGINGLVEHVSLLGERDDVEEMLPGLSLFVLSSAFGEAFRWFFWKRWRPVLPAWRPGWVTSPRSSVIRSRGAAGTPTRWPQPSIALKSRRVCACKSGRRRPSADDRAIRPRRHASSLRRLACELTRCAA